MVFQSVFGVVNSTRLLPKPKLGFKKMKKRNYNFYFSCTLFAAGC